MAYYMYQATYTSEAWKALIKKPVNRFDAVRPAIEKLGGKIEGAWFTFGEYDFVVIIEMPDNVCIGAWALAVAAGGAIKAAKTTPLITPSEGLAAMKRAGRAGYRPVKK